MKKYTHINDISDLKSTIRDAIKLKINPFEDKSLGENKTLVMLFFNASLRTRLSTEKAAKNLGMNVMTLNVSDTWKLEFEEGKIMTLDKAEHVKEAARVISQYADIIAIRAFPTLQDRKIDESEKVISSFVKYASVPIVSLESATGHPLQALADAITIEETKNVKKPKVVLSWAPHPKALPHAVPNSFVEMMQRLDVDLTITHPEGYDLSPKIVKDTFVTKNQEHAFENADYVYVKNWSSYNSYGKVLSVDRNWTVTTDKLNDAKFMHCLPVRRNIIVDDNVLDGDNSLVIEQANNRTYAAQVILKKILEEL